MPSVGAFIRLAVGALALSLLPMADVGAGILQTRESFFTGTFTSTEGAFTGGGGVRARVSESERER